MFIFSLVMHQIMSEYLKVKYVGVWFRTRNKFKRFSVMMM